MAKNVVYDPELVYDDNPYCQEETIPDWILNMSQEELEKAIKEEERARKERERLNIVL